MTSLVTNHLLPTGYCFVWQPELVWLNALSYTIIFISCMVIPVVMWCKLYKKGQFMPHKWLLIGFTTLIFLIGLVSLFSAISIWYPFYYLVGILKVALATLFLASAVLSFPLVSYIGKQLQVMRESHEDDDS